jgi:hypothetical protein
MPAYIVHKDGAFNIYTTVADGFYFDVALTGSELAEFYKAEHGESGMHEYPERVARAVENGTSSLIGHDLKGLIECNAEGMPYDKCIEKYLTLPVAHQVVEEPVVTPTTLKEALRICVSQLKELTSNQYIYDDVSGKKISLVELDKLIL